MKTTLKFQLVLIVLALFPLANVASAQGVSVAAKGEFQFEATEIDYGTIEKDSDGTRTFSFTNVGSVPIVITDIKSSCGCTVPTKPKGPIMPGQTAEIGVKYKTSKVGAFTKSITVLSNANEPKKNLKIRGIVVDSKNKLGE